MKKKTKLTQIGRSSCEHGGMVNPPIYQTSTVVFPTLEAYHDAEMGKAYYPKKGNSLDHSYGITGTPTTFALQESICELEGGDACVITQSGLSAITTVLMSYLKCGDHLLMVDTVYGPTRRFCNNELKKFGIETTYYDPLIGGNIKDLIKKNTKLIFLESPGSLTFEIQDIPAIVKAAKKKNIITAIDNSWATPLFCTPLDLGVDLSIHAVTKYIGGHSDIFLGAIISKGESVTRKLLSCYRSIGVSASPYDCYLALRGIRTMATRLEAQQKTTMKVIEWMEKSPKVSKILYPAYKKNSGYDLWKELYTGAASLFSVVLDKKYSDLGKITDNLELFGIGASWGGYESLVLDFTPTRTATKWTETNSCLRFYIGLEDAEDLISDLERGFSST